MESQSEISVIDTEDYIPGKEEKFSHSSLVMRALSKCLENGSREMRTGYWNERTDKEGNKIKTYIEDTRKVFIESVETAMMIIKCDIDSEAKEKIKEIEDELKEKYEQLVKEEETDWSAVPISIRQQRWKQGIHYKKGCLNKTLYFYQEYIDEEVKAYRKIVGELSLLTKRLNFYQEEMWEA